MHGVVDCVLCWVWLSSVAWSCATRDDTKKDNVCSPTISSGINRPSHPDYLAYTLSAEPTQTDSTPWRWTYSCNASRIVRVSPSVLPGISTFPSFLMSRPTRGGIGAGGFNTDAGGVIDAGAGTSRAVASAGDGAATGRYFGIGT